MSNPTTMPIGVVGLGLLRNSEPRHEVSCGHCRKKAC